VSSSSCLKPLTILYGIAVVPPLLKTLKSESKNHFVQYELNFQSKPKTFCSGRAKVNFAQSYLKGMALEWFEPDLLSDENTIHPDWMDDYSKFMLELQTNFGPHDPSGDAEMQLEHLNMHDGQHIDKYIVEFQQLASQVHGWGDGALKHQFYNGLPACIKDEISRCLVT